MINISFNGNVTAQPELRFAPSGMASCNFTVAHNAQKFDKQQNRWVDLDPTFIRCTAFRGLAERIGEDIQRGDSVVVMGKLRQNTWTDKEGIKRVTLEVMVDDLAASVKNAHVRISKVDRSSQATSQRQERREQPQDSRPARHEEPLDPWANAGAPSYDEPPF